MDENISLQAKLVATKSLKLLVCPSGERADISDEATDIKVTIKIAQFLLLSAYFLFVIYICLAVISVTYFPLI